MTKSELRRQYLQKRNQFNSKEIENLSIQICNQLEKLDIWDKTVFHLFQSIPSKNEVQTSSIQTKLAEKHKIILVPKIKESELVSCLIDENTSWINGKFNVPEPVHCQIYSEDKIEVVFVPLLICDLQGNRIGYGGGFYDRFLTKCPSSTLKIGLNFFAPILKIEEIEEFDIPLDYCVTPEEIVSF